MTPIEIAMRIGLMLAFALATWAIIACWRESIRSRDSDPPYIISMAVSVIWAIFLVFIALHIQP